MIEVMSVPPVGLMVLMAGLLLATAVGCSYSVPRQNIVSHHQAVQIGDSTVNIVVHEADSSGLTYVNLHDDEDTSVKAALKLMRRRGGRLVELNHTDKRNVTFALGDSSFTFDPNRMFTEKGRLATLAEFGAAPPRAQEEVAALADSVLEALKLESLPMIVAVHNNKSENKQGNYSVLSYTEKGDMANEALFAYVTDEEDPDDFFFVTDRSLYNRLRNGHFNAVLQDNARATDDGSLSVYCARKQVSYVNVEAQHGHLDYQLEMLSFLNEMADGVAKE